MKLYDLFKKLEENGTLTIVDEREDSSYIYLHLCDAEEYEGECEGEIASSILVGEGSGKNGPSLFCLANIFFL